MAWMPWRPWLKDYHHHHCRHLQPRQSPSLAYKQILRIREAYKTKREELSKKEISKMEVLLYWIFLKAF